MDSQTDNTNDLDFQDLVSNYYQPLYRFAYSLARNAEEASDLAQQTFLIWAKKGSSLKDKTKVKSWLFTTLYREFLGLRRKSSRFPLINAEAIEHELPSISPNVVSSMDSKSALEALNNIDETFRGPLVLFYMKDLSYKEIAEILEIPIGTVMSRLSRGKAQLKNSSAKPTQTSYDPSRERVKRNMTNDQAKFILQAYRKGQDVSDSPEMEAALKLLEESHELQQWYEEDQAFDNAFALKLENLEIPKGLDQKILSQVLTKKDNVIEFPWWKQLSVLGAVASFVLVIGLILLPTGSNHFVETVMTVETFHEFANQSLKNSFAFNARSKDWGTLVQYLNEHGTPAPDSLPDNMDQLPPVGCMTLEFDQKPVGMICFGKNSKSHLFVINAEDFPQMPKRQIPILEENSFATSAYWTGNERHYLLIGQEMKDITCLFQVILMS